MKRKEIRHLCQPLTFEDVAEIRCAEDIKSAARELGGAANRSVVLKIIENVQQVFSSWIPKQTPNQYAKSLTSYKYNYKNRERMVHERDAVYPMVPKIIGLLGYNFLGRVNVEHRWPMFQNERMLIGKFDVNLTILPVA